MTVDWLRCSKFARFAMSLWMTVGNHEIQSWVCLRTAHFPYQVWWTRLIIFEVERADAWRPIFNLEGFKSVLCPVKHLSKISMLSYNNRHNASITQSSPLIRLEILRSQGDEHRNDDLLWCIAVWMGSCLPACSSSTALYDTLPLLRTYVACIIEIENLKS